MRRHVTVLIAVLTLGSVGVVPAHAGIINLSSGFDVAGAETDFGIALTSLTGPLPNLGDVGTSETVGNATLTAGNTIFISNAWSTLIPGNEIAISGVENLTITLDNGPSTAFGFFFLEPGSNTAQLDGCNTTCAQSQFDYEFYLGAALVGTLGVGLGSVDDTPIFIAFLLDMPFDRVVIKEVVGTHDNEFFGEMYVAAATVPEPALLVLMGAGLAATEAFVRRRRRAVTR